MYKFFAIAAAILYVLKVCAEIPNVSSAKPPVRDGLYLHIGIGFPAQTYLGYTSPMRPQINIELGNQYLFLKTEKSGVGFKVSWFQIGYMNEVVDGISTSVPRRIHTFDIRLLKFGPQYSVALSKNVALDISIDISPTAMFATGNFYGQSSLIRYLGIFIGPNLRFRYKKWAIGAELAFGKLTSKDLDKYSNPNQMSYPSNYIYPRVYLGLQF